MSRSARAPGPLPNSYWVLPGRLLAGEHPAARSQAETRERLTRLTAAGIDCFVDLTNAAERGSYEPDLPAGTAYVRMPIRDHGLPERPAQMTEILEYIARALDSGRRPYVHCRAGIGRTGMVIGCLLIERGLTPDDALYELNLMWQDCARARDWPYVPETDEQIEYVRGWTAGGAAPGSRVPGASHPAHERFAGALIGLAVCDARAAESGGSEPGMWSDDTAMALCLAESLLECDGFDPHDQVARYTQWREHGQLSASGRSTGARIGTTRALALAQWRRQAFSGSHDPDQLDPEPLSRVAPAVMFCFGKAEEGERYARDAARITCQAPLVLDACRLLAVSLHAALEGRSKHEVLSAGERLAAAGQLRDPVAALARRAYASRAPASIRADDNAIQALEAALWAFDLARGFEDGAARLLDLGGASDVAGAVYGQLAGAHFGLEAIPAAWRNGLMRKELIAGFADRLYRRAARVPHKI